jgi:hypothetical protein
MTGIGEHLGKMAPLVKVIGMMGNHTHQLVGVKSPIPACAVFRQKWN